jgi:predicted nucleotidyltransferase
MNKPLSPLPSTLALAQKIAAHFTPLEQVAAVALAGSLMAGTGDESSDLDMYVYVRAEVPLEQRAAVAKKCAARQVEIGW